MVILFRQPQLSLGFFSKIFGPSLAVCKDFKHIFCIGRNNIFISRDKTTLLKMNILALATAAVLTINPLLVFFGRQTDLINPGFFFGLLGLYFYIKWIETPSYQNLLIFSISITLCVLTKYPNALIGIPMASNIPLQQNIQKRQPEKILASFVYFLAVFPQFHYGNGTYCFLFRKTRGA